MTRRDAKLFLDKVIVDNIQPQTPLSGIGLYVASDRKRVLLINQKGDLTLNGKYYYNKLNQEPPSILNLSQIPFRKGRSLAINTLDGKKE
jgi:hypothetical protein